MDCVHAMGANEQHATISTEMCDYISQKTILTCERVWSASKIRFAVKLVTPLVPSPTPLCLSFTG